LLLIYRSGKEIVCKGHRSRGFSTPRAGHGGAVVAGARVDPVENDHRRALFADRPEGQHYDDDSDELQQHAKPHQLLRTVGRASACMLVNPSNNTTATAPIAMGTRA